MHMFKAKIRLLKNNDKEQWCNKLTTAWNIQNASKMSENYACKYRHMCEISFWYVA